MPEWSGTFSGHISCCSFFLLFPPPLDVDLQPGLLKAWRWSNRGVGIQPWQESTGSWLLSLLPLPYLLTQTAESPPRLNPPPLHLEAGAWFLPPPSPSPPPPYYFRLSNFFSAPLSRRICISRKLVLEENSRKTFKKNNNWKIRMNSIIYGGLGEFSDHLLSFS